MYLLMKDDIYAYLFRQIYENSRNIEIVEGSVTKSFDNAAHPSGVSLDPSSPQDDSSTEHFFFDGVRIHLCFPKKSASGHTG